jgi:hypothetical protein
MVIRSLGLPFATSAGRFGPWPPLPQLLLEDIFELISIYKNLMKKREENFKRKFHK